MDPQTHTQHDGGCLSRLEVLKLVDLNIPTAMLADWVEGLATHRARLQVSEHPYFCRTTT